MAFKGDTTYWPNHATVHVPQSGELAALLRTVGVWCERAGLASAAEPSNGATGCVTVLQHHRGAVVDELAQALNRIPAGTPGRDELVDVARQMGVTEAEPEPAPEPEPGAGVPAAPTLSTQGS